MKFSQLLSYARPASGSEKVIAEEKERQAEKKK